jgi:hypothetical protein
MSNREVETPEGPACPRCGCEMEWEWRDQRGFASWNRTYVNIFMCSNHRECDNEDRVEVEEARRWD